jgi:hypothetical protein
VTNPYIYIEREKGMKRKRENKIDINIIFMNTDRGGYIDRKGRGREEMR